MVRIATLTVAIGMAVMVLSLAVINGFRTEITDRLVGFGGYVRIVPLTASASLEGEPMIVDSTLMERVSEVDGFREIWRFALKGGILKTNDAIAGIVLKGVGTDYNMDFFRNNLVAGDLPNVADSVRHKDLLISRRLASTLSLEIGDRVEALFITESNPTKRDRYKICGFYSTGMEEMDRVITLTDIRNIQRLNGWSEQQITGYEVVGSDINKVQTFSDSIYMRLLDANWTMENAIKAEDVRSLYPGLFDWLAAHNVNAAVIIVIMVLVALLNMMSAMLIILLEKSRMIGILKALGMSNGRVQRVFVFRSMGIILRGMIWGNAVGIGLAMIQKLTGIIKLDSSGYMLSEVPIAFDWEWWLMLNIGVPLVIGLLLTIPAMAVSAIKPDRTIRYQ